jgi:hypothetical protein
MKRAALVSRLLLGLCGLALAACGPSTEGLDVAQLPPGIQPDYQVFAQRCSKCHSLARPLESGISDDEFWRQYVERMRKQPASGINKDDEAVILRFLHYYSAETRRKRLEQGNTG